MRIPHQGELLEFVERIVVGTEVAGEKTVILNTQAARALLELAKLAPKPRGRPPLKGHNQIAVRVAALIEITSDKTITLKATIVRSLLELAKRAPKPRGHQPLGSRDRTQEHTALRIAHFRKNKLAAAGMRREAAHEKAAEEASVRLLKPRNLSVFTIMRMMEGWCRR